MKRLISLALVCLMAIGCLHPDPTPDFPFLGIDANWHRYNDPSEAGPLGELSDYCRESHFSTVRVGTSWGQPEHIEAAIAWAKSTGAPEVLVDVWPDAPVTPGAEWFTGWYEEPETWLLAWSIWAKDITNRHPDVLWMFGNEPNRLGGLAGRPLLWAAIYNTFVSEARPGTIVVGPALGHSTDTVDNMDWLKNFLEMGGLIDVVGVHPYDQGAETMEGVKTVLGGLNLDLPVWAVETSGSPITGPRAHVGELQGMGYERVVYHVMGGWRPEDRPTSPLTVPLILINRTSTGMAVSPAGNALRELGKEMGDVEGQ